MVVRSVGVFSLGKVLGVIYGFLGLIIGGFVAIFSMLGAAVGMAQGEGSAIIGAFFGVGAIIFMPLLYGFLAFLVGIIVGALYNAAAAMFGGIEVQLSGYAAGGATVEAGH